MFLWLAKKNVICWLFLLIKKGGAQILKIRIPKFRIFYLGILKFRIQKFGILVIRILNKVLLNSKLSEFFSSLLN